MYYILYSYNKVNYIKENVKKIIRENTHTGLNELQLLKNTYV